MLLSRGTAVSTIQHPWIGGIPNALHLRSGNVKQLGRRKAAVCAKLRNGSSESSGPASKFTQSVPPPNPPPARGPLGERTVLVGAALMIAGLAAILYSQRPKSLRKGQGSVEAEQQEEQEEEAVTTELPRQEAAVTEQSPETDEIKELAAEEDLSVIIDSIKPLDPDTVNIPSDPEIAKLEVARLEAARAALQRRLTDLDGPVGSPTVPDEDLSTANLGADTLDFAAEATALTDPTADVSIGSDDEETQASIAAVQETLQAESSGAVAAPETPPQPVEPPVEVASSSPRVQEAPETSISAPQEDAATEEAAAVPHVRRSQLPVPKVPGQLRLVGGGACIPAPAKLAAGKNGEDAFFVSTALWGAMGVADGVGSWTTDGIDPSLYSRQLLEVAAAATEHGWGRQDGQGVRGLLHIAQTGTMDVAGTSTACIAQMMQGTTLQVANLGDSGFRVFRGAECVFASEVQQHSFNCPYQAGSPKLLPHCDTADDAMVYELGLQENDLVLMATDGVFDNLWDAELEALLATYLDGREAWDASSDDAVAVAEAVVAAAHARCNDPRARTPWIVEAASQQPGLLPFNLRLRPRGGKPDDCTATVGLLAGI